LLFYFYASLQIAVKCGSAAARQCGGRTCEVRQLKCGQKNAAFFVDETFVFVTLLLFIHYSMYENRVWVMCELRTCEPVKCELPCELCRYCEPRTWVKCEPPACTTSTSAGRGRFRPDVLSTRFRVFRRSCVKLTVLRLTTTSRPIARLAAKMW